MAGVCDPGPSSAAALTETCCKDPVTRIPWRIHLAGAVLLALTLLNCQSLASASRSCVFVERGVTVARLSEPVCQDVFELLLKSWS